MKASTFTENELDPKYKWTFRKHFFKGGYYGNTTTIMHLMFFLWEKAFFFLFFLVAPTLGSLLPLLEHRAEFPQFLDQG
jgi:hypothetical protein